MEQFSTPQNSKMSKIILVVSEMSKIILVVLAKLKSRN
jgi:hypothetical protein